MTDSRHAGTHTADCPPSFLLSGPEATVIAEGVHTAFDDLAEAHSALSSGAARIILGALPFDLNHRAALMQPQRCRTVKTPPRWPVRPLPAVHIADTIPPPDQHRRRIRDALTALRDPHHPVTKVVLARAIDVVADAPLDALTLLARLAAADPHAFTYYVDLTPAGGPYHGAALLGATPELLVQRRGEHVRCQPFAGSAPRSADAETDRANAAALAESAKNRHEHALVVDAIRASLDPLCVDVRITDPPQLTRTAAVWHLSTPISARLRKKSTTAMDLALALHPTPAVGGVPVEAATAIIGELEGQRGFYAGAAGWCDHNGDGRWVLSIRCAQLAADRRSARTYSGGGIVAESDPEDELTETTTKFRTMLAALGVNT